jgi:hypothetical protein
MKRGTFPAAFYGRAVASIGLPAGIPALRAILLDATHIRCGAVYVNDANPVAALCRQLQADGVLDGAMAISWADRTPAMFVQSIHSSAWSAERLARPLAKVRE